MNALVLRLPEFVGLNAAFVCGIVLGFQCAALRGRRVGAGRLLAAPQSTADGERN